MPKKTATQKQHLLEMEDLQMQLDEAQKTIQAIRNGEADALIVAGNDGEQLFTLKGADYSYRILIEDMNEGALTLTMEGLILYANRRFAEILKSPLEKVIGSTIQTWIAPDNQLALQLILGQGVDEKRREQSVLTAGDGTKVPVYLSVSKLSKSELPYSFCIVATDLTEQKRADAIEASEKMTRELLAASNQSRQALLSVIEDQKRAEEIVRKSLAEKEILLKEVHHRVKNNMMIIISLIKMQETKAANEMFNPLLQELEGRIRAMAQVHEVLHNSADLARINLQNYIETMIVHIRSQFGSERSIHFDVQASGVDLKLDIAIPCGLILNELITNAYKHAFPAGQPGEICISFQERTGTARRAPTFELTVADNGVGLPAGMNLDNPETLGLRLVKMLSQQLNGSIALDRSAGAVFCLKFPVSA
jgi:PAS domain S-box-containing protein